MRTLLSFKSMIISLTASFCLLVATLLGTGCETLVSDQQEVSIGQQYEQQLEQEKNVRSVPFLSQMGQQLAQYAPARPGINYQFSMIEDPDMNAFAIPGGHIYVHSETIKAVDNASELAGVLAHEISHVALLHHRKSMGQAVGVDLLSQMVLREQGQAVQTGAQLLGQGVMQSFSRSQENEADDLAIDIMYRAGYNPMGLVTFFEKLTARYGEGSRWLTFLSSHPMTADRVANVRRKIQQLPPKPGLIDDTSEFRAYRQSL